MEHDWVYLCKSSKLVKAIGVSFFIYVSWTDDSAANNNDLSRRLVVPLSCGRISDVRLLPNEILESIIYLLP